jgi:glycosyltransferase involved in cell wall biosynthesis
VIVVENSFVPFDIRVWYEATTLRDNGWRVTVICPSPPQSNGRADLPTAGQSPVSLQGVDVFYFPNSTAREGILQYAVEYLTAFSSISRLTWRIWRHSRFDVLQFCNPPDIFFPISWFYRALGTGTIFDHHDLFPELVGHRYSGLSGRLLYRIARVMEYLTYRCAHVVVAVNESYRDIAIRRGRLSPDKVIIVRNGPKAHDFVPVEPSEALRKGFRLLACFVGVMGYEDGVLELLESIRYLIHDLGRRDILFVLIGSGAVRSQALEHVERWGLGRYVEMPGLIFDRLLIRQYLSTADICLAPEPLSPLNASSTFIKVGEYMAMGKPIVAYDLKETHWTAQEASLYVAPGDTRGFARAISVLADDTDQRARMGTFARHRFLDRLCWEHQQHDLLRAYRAALNGKKLREGPNRD